MKSNISRVLLLCALALWITFGDAVIVKDGNYLKADPLKRNNHGQIEKIIKNIVLWIQDADHQVNNEQQSVNRIPFKKVLHHGQTSRGENPVADSRRYVFTKGGKHALKYSARTTRGQGGKIFLTKSDGGEHDGSIITNKDLVTRSEQKSIPSQQYVGTSGHRDVKDLTFLYVGNSVRDTYRNRYHETKAKDGLKQGLPSSASRKSFDGLSGHYKSRGSGSLINGGRGLKTDNETYYGTAAPAYNLNLVLLSRKKRSERESIWRATGENGAQSDLDNLTVSVSHSDQMSWPDKTNRAGNKIASSFVNTNAVQPTDDNMPQTTASIVKDTTTSLPTGRPSKSTNVIPVSTIQSIPVDLKSSFDGTTESQFTDTSIPLVLSTPSTKVTDQTTSVSANSPTIPNEPSSIGFAHSANQNVSLTVENIPTVTTAKTDIVQSTSKTVVHVSITEHTTKPTIKSSPDTSIVLNQELTTNAQIKSSVDHQTLLSPPYVLQTSPEPFPEPTIQTSPEPTTQTSPEPTTEVSPEPTTEVSPEPTTEVSPEPTTEVSPEPTTETSPEPTTEVSPEPTTEVSPEPTTEVSPEPITEVSPEPISEVSPEPTTEILPEPTTETSPEPTPEKSAELKTVLSSKPTTQLATKTSPKPTAKTTVVSSPETTSVLSSTSKIFLQPTKVTSPELMVEPSPEPTPEAVQTSKVVVLKTISIQEPTTEPKTSAEPVKTLKTDIPVIFLPEADETVADEITKISNSSNTTLLSESNATEPSSTNKDAAQTPEPSSPTSGSSPTTLVSEPLPTPISETNPTSTNEPEPEPSSPEPEGTPPNAPSESTPVAVAEPGPDWDDAKKKWSIAWEIHLYMLGGIFVVIALYALTSMIKLFQINRLLSKKYFITLNLLIFVLCTLRAVFLLVDGYNANGTFHPVANYLLYSTAFPCLTSAFSILLYALLQATQMRLVPPRVQKIQILIVIIFFHFALQMTTDVLVGTYAGMSIMLFVCQLVFICWGLFLFFGYAYIFRYLYSSAVKRQKNYQYMLTGKLYPSGGESYKHKFTLSLAVKVTFMAAILGLVTIGLEIYAIVAVYGVFSDKKPEAWPWWLYHTALRLVECLMCIIMVYVASQPFRCREVKTCGFMCAPCLEICQCGGKDELSDKLGWSEYDRLYMTTNKRSNGHTNGKKKKIYLNEGTDIVPIVIQPSTTEESRPPSMLIIEDGYVRFQAETDINKIVDNYSKTHGTEMTTFPNYDGIVNGAYIRSMEDTVRFQDDVASSDGFTRKSRKSSLASSGFFRPPSSISLADSMESEIDKAFRSMHQDSTSRLRASSHSLPSRSTYSMDDNFQGPAIEAYIEQVVSQQGVSLRRSRSALGDLNIHRPESWRQKLFRSRSDSSGGVRTKDLDSMRYLSLLDLEKQQEKNVSFASGTVLSRDSDNSDDSSSDNQSRTYTQDVVKRLLKKETSEPEEIDV